MSLGQSFRSADLSPADACSYAELQNAELMAKMIESAGRPVLWRPVWVRTGAELLAAATAVAATFVGLIALLSPLASGVSLAVLLALWSLEVGRLPSPLARLCPTSATQDLIAVDQSEATRARRPVLLLARTDATEPTVGPVAAFCSRAGELAWAIIALTLCAVAARALDSPEGVIGVIQAIPAICSLTLMAAVLLPKRTAARDVATDWTGLGIALKLIDSTGERTEATYHLTVVGATGLDGAARALRADPNFTAAWRCWEFSSSEQLRAAIEAGR